MEPRAAASASSGRIASAGGMSCCSRLQHAEQFGHRHAVIGKAGAQPVVLCGELRDARIGVGLFPLQVFDAGGGVDQLLRSVAASAASWSLFSLAEASCGVSCFSSEDRLFSCWALDGNLASAWPGKAWLKSMGGSGVRRRGHGRTRTGRDRGIDRFRTCFGTLRRSGKAGAAASTRGKSRAVFRVTPLSPEGNGRSSGRVS